jgi:hypothetical protein
MIEEKRGSYAYNGPVNLEGLKLMNLGIHADKGSMERITVPFLMNDPPGPVVRFDSDAQFALGGGHFQDFFGDDMVMNIDHGVRHNNLSFFFVGERSLGIYFSCFEGRSSWWSL